MKIEKINENQIKCTLNKSDLASRQIKISELAYGSEKAKDLFRDMMQQASYELGFEAEDIPLMIEAIPISSDCIILVITKVEDPDELDTRFSKFAPMEEEFEYEDEYLPESSQTKADSVLDLFRAIESQPSITDTSDFVPLSENLSEHPNAPRSSENKKSHGPSSGKETADLCFIYSFQNLDDVFDAANVLFEIYHGENSLYKNPVSNQFYLVLHKNTMSAAAFNRVCNILSEYGQKENINKKGDSYFREHYKSIIHKHALQTLSSI